MKPGSGFIQQPAIRLKRVPAGTEEEMGSSLGCVKEQKEKAVGKAPLSPKKRVRFKRRRRGKRRAMPAAAPQEEPPVLEVTEDEEAAKWKAAPQKEGGQEPPGSRHGAGDPKPASLQPGLIVQVKERFQGEVQKARLVLEPAAVGLSREEGTTVIARLLENPAEKGCEKAVSRLVELQRSGAGNRRAVLLPLRGGDADGHAGGVVAPVSTRPGEEPAKSREPVAGSARGAWGRGGSDNPSSSAAWTCSSSAEPGTVSELSTPSPMVDQLENPSMGTSSVLPSSRDGQGLPGSRSPSSFSGGAARSSSGYGSDPARRSAKGAGAGGTVTPRGDSGRRLAAEGRARSGSSGTAEGMVSVCMCPRPAFGTGRGIWFSSPPILVAPEDGHVDEVQPCAERREDSGAESCRVPFPLRASLPGKCPRDRPVPSSAPGTGGRRAGLARVSGRVCCQW